MNEIAAIIKAYNRAWELNQEAVLATVVRVDGSSYRRPGARMLVTDDGQITGAISGGCLEGDALNRALLAAYQKTKKLITYDTTQESDAAIGVQLGCNGIVHILFEYIDPQHPNNPLVLLEAVTKYRTAAIVAVGYNLENRTHQIGTCQLMQEGGKHMFPNGKDLEELVVPEMLAQVFEERRSHQVIMRQQEIGQQFLLDYIPPPIALVIFGAGNDAQPLAVLAATLGWKVTIIDGRATHATPVRFPTASEVRVLRASEALASLPIDRYTAAVLMSHNYRYDRDILSDLIRSQIPYIGSLGPKKRLARLLADLQDTGTTISSTNNLYGPVGLDIGAETSEEIALAIVAEIKTVMSNRKGSFLRNLPAKMHEETATVNASICL